MDAVTLTPDEIKRLADPNKPVFYGECVLPPRLEWIPELQRFGVKFDGGDGLIVSPKL